MTDWLSAEEVRAYKDQRRAECWQGTAAYDSGDAKDEWWSPAKELDQCAAAVAAIETIAELPEPIELPADCAMRMGDHDLAADIRNMRRIWLVAKEITRDPS